MNNNILKISIIILMLFANMANSQNVTIDYSTFSSTACNIFGTPVSVNGITHQTTIGQPKYNSSNQSIKLEYNYNNNAQKGTEYKISYNFKANYTYLITLTMRNATPNGVSTGIELRGSFGDNGSNSLCEGAQLITGNSNLPSVTPVLNSNIFQDYVYDTATLSSPASFVRFTTRTDYIPNPQLQTIEIQKIVINEIPPPPSFSLSPTTVAIPCNSTSPVTFSVTSANIPVGATLTYNWSYSNWQGNNTNTNTITLTPPNSGSLPSSVTVTPVLNGVNQPSKTCTVSRAAFSSIAAITGPTGICTGNANYSISNIAAGQTVSWSLSNANIGSLSNQSNAGVTVAFAGNGAQTLTASITNPCGQTTTKTFLINTGSTTFTSTASISGGVSSICSGTRIYTVNNVLAGQTVNWVVSDTNIATLSTSTGTQTTVNFIGSGTLSLSAVVSNSCGQTATRTIEVYSGFATSTGFTSTPSGRDFTSGAPIEVESYSLPILNLNDKIIASFAGLTSAQEGVPSNWEWQALNSKISISGSRNARTIMLVDYGITGVKVRTKNACGWSPWVETQFEIVEIPPIWSKQSNSNKTDEYTIFPNPSKDVINIASISKSNFPQKEVKIYGELFDLLGISKTKIEIIDGKALFSVKELKKGIYILKIFINDKIETHQIAVE